MLPLVSDKFTSLGELRSVPRLLHETSLPFQGPRAGNSALFEAAIDELRFKQAEKNKSSLKKNAYSVHERERRWELDGLEKSCWNASKTRFGHLFPDHINI
ncbi:hypothetical protein CDAR_446121 [Caerostris darwini]|uniref:Uncharacterized protein n=1 Tax=Caerostris darwini TaxID=1538125 RepID=A0AAV4SQW0_9ARAC|nr:hypothetical protein CDAR_446121 [Caerostris darwini]